MLWIIAGSKRFNLVNKLEDNRTLPRHLRSILQRGESAPLFSRGTATKRDCRHFESSQSRTALEAAFGKFRGSQTGRNYGQLPRKMRPVYSPRHPLSRPPLVLLGQYRKWTMCTLRVYNAPWECGFCVRYRSFLPQGDQCRSAWLCTDNKCI